MSRKGRVFWITGVSGAGKSTVSRIIVDCLRERGEHAILIDGDEIREILGDLKHDGNSRLSLGMQYAKLGRLLANQGTTVLVATISLFRELHAFNRQNLPGYFEVYLKAPLELLKERDPKGLYRGFEDGLVNSVAGLDLPIEEPLVPDLVVEMTPDLQAIDVARTIMAAAGVSSKMGKQ